jgi:flagellar biosynthesis protein
MAEPYDLAAEVVALHYDPETSGAPQLVAKGSGHIGNRIVELAQQHQIPLYQDPELTRLLAQLELGDEIPETLYKAIAQVILFAWELSAEMDLDHDQSS